MRIRFVLALAILGLLVTTALAPPIATSRVALDSRSASSEESTLADVVADAMRAAGKSDAALLNASQLRPTLIPAGPVELAAIVGVLLYPDEHVVVAEITGAKLAAALERGVTIAPKPNKGFLQVSGISYQYDSRRKEDRLVGVIVGQKPLDPAKKYTVAMPASLAQGALGYFKVFDGLKAKDTGRSLRQVVADYLKAHPEITLKPAEGEPAFRIKDLAPPPALQPES